MKRSFVLAFVTLGCGEAPSPPPDPHVVAALESTAQGKPDVERRSACVALGRVGGPLARDRLLELLEEKTGDAERDGWIHLYAAVGLTILSDPGTAVDLVLRLSKVNPNDALAARAAPERDDEYFTIDAQICDALLGMGILDAEESLVEQLRRRHRVRVAIDAVGVLRRRTGLDLPFRYNGSYADRDADASAWEAKLRETRAARRARRPFDAKNARFRRRLAEVVSWLGGKSINDRYIAEKALVLLGPPAAPSLVALLATDGVQAQREAALVLGRMLYAPAAPALRAALRLKDDDARAKSVEALRRIGDREALAAVRTLLADRDPAVRARAAHFVGEFGDAGDRDRLVARLGEEADRGARAWVACALLLRDGDADGKLGARRMVEEAEQVDREAALAALGRAGK